MAPLVTRSGAQERASRAGARPPCRTCKQRWPNFHHLRVDIVHVVRLRNGLYFNGNGLLLPRLLGAFEAR